MSRLALSCLHHSNPRANPRFLRVLMVNTFYHDHISRLFVKHTDRTDAEHIHKWRISHDYTCQISRHSLTYLL